MRKDCAKMKPTLFKYRQYGSEYWIYADEKRTVLCGDRSAVIAVATASPYYDSNVDLNAFSRVSQTDVRDAPR